MVTHVIKSSQNIEPYNETKLAKSITKVLISADVNKDDAKKMSFDIIANLQDWLAKKTQVTSLDIRVRVTLLLEKVDHHAAVIYKKHKDLW